MSRNNGYYYEDEYMYFTFKNTHSSVYNLIMQNNIDDLKIISEKGTKLTYASPQYQNGQYLLGVQNPQKSFPLKVVAENVTRQDCLDIVKWLEPGTKGTLSFDFAPDWEYDVVVSACSNPNMYAVDGENFVFSTSVTFVTLEQTVARNVVDNVVSLEFNKNIYNGYIIDTDTIAVIAAIDQPASGMITFNWEHPRLQGNDLECYYKKSVDNSTLAIKYVCYSDPLLTNEIIGTYISCTALGIVNQIIYNRIAYDASPQPKSMQSDMNNSLGIAPSKFFSANDDYIRIHLLGDAYASFDCTAGFNEPPDENKAEPFYLALQYEDPSKHKQFAEARLYRPTRETTTSATGITPLYTITYDNKSNLFLVDGFIGEMMVRNNYLRGKESEDDTIYTTFTHNPSPFHINSPGRPICITGYTDMAIKQLITTNYDWFVCAENNADSFIYSTDYNTQTQEDIIADIQNLNSTTKCYFGYYADIKFSTNYDYIDMHITHYTNSI